MILPSLSMGFPVILLMLVLFLELNGSEALQRLVCLVSLNRFDLGGGFRYFLFSPGSRGK